MATKRTSKKPKKDQPKRKRYIAERRTWKNAIRNLERHMKRYNKDGNDNAAEEALERLRNEYRAW